MCGIVGAISSRDIVPILMDGLRRLEYRGYDSAGVAILTEQATIARSRVEGKVAGLQEQLRQAPLSGLTGIAHTRWATHGIPNEANAHPHVAGHRVALVHNGIFENYQALREPLLLSGYELQSETDSEVIAGCLLKKMEAGANLLSAVQQMTEVLEGAYAFCAMDRADPERIIGARKGPPLVVGLGTTENFLASDALALQRVVDRFIYLEDGDVVEMTKNAVNIYDKMGAAVERQIHHRTFQHDSVDKAGYRHFMLKEIYEQPNAIRDTLTGRLQGEKLLEAVFGVNATPVFDAVQQVQIIACGTSYHAGLVGRLWIEDLANMPCQVEIASEFRYRKKRLLPNTLFVFISQSGETADTLAALRSIQAEVTPGMLLSICNVPDSSLVRESNSVFLTGAGPEIGVCSTKAFTTQLIGLILLTIALGRRRGLEEVAEKQLIHTLLGVPDLIQQCLAKADELQGLAKLFGDKAHALFLGRGLQYPIALEGALKLKEISYIHAEAYAAGELKHGPLALVDKEMPVIVIAPNDHLLEKLKSNIQEVRARGGELIVFTPKSTRIEPGNGIHVFTLPEAPALLAPIIYTVPLQLLAYYVAVLKGTDVDQPRNLAKSVTVE